MNFEMDVYDIENLFITVVVGAGFIADLMKDLGNAAKIQFGTFTILIHSVKLDEKLKQH